LYHCDEKNNLKNKDKIKIMGLKIKRGQTGVVAWLFKKSQPNHPPLEVGSKSEAIRGGID